MEFSYKNVIREKIVIINLGSFLGQVQERADSSMGDLGRSPTMEKKCEPLDERSYDVPSVAYFCLSH